MKLSEIKEVYTFTYIGMDALVYYEDTEEGDSKRNFHSYRNGELYSTSSTVPTDKNFFYCTDT